MAETTTLRLMAAAKEFNIGKDTLVDFLASKGFSKDDLKPTSKLTEDMYRSLQQEFQQDKVAKIKSDQIDLPKGSLEAKKKKEDETVLFPKKEIVKKPVAKEEAPVVEEPPVVVPPVVVVEDKQEEPEITKIDAPELEGPKVINKIDLSTIDSSTRPKKIIKKAAGENGVELPVTPEETPVEAVLPEQTEEKEIPQEEKEIDEPVVEELPPHEEPVIIAAIQQPEEVVIPEPEKEIPQEELPVAEE